MANIILPQVNILNEIDDSTKLMVEQNGEINRYPISELDLGGGDVTIDLDGDSQGTAAGINADTLGGFSADEYLRTGDNSNINAATLNNQLPEYYLNKDNIVNNFDTIEENFVADARALKVLNDNKLSMELLWENASPTSEFAAQTIGLTLNEGDLLLFIIPNLISSDLTNHNYNSYFTCYVGELLYANCIINVKSTTVVFSVNERSAEVTTTGVIFSDAYNKKAGEATTITRNERMIPFRIYRVKGVSA